MDTYHRTVLKHYYPPLKSIPERLELMKPNYRLDPAGDPKLIADPIFNAYTCKSGE